jgi:hypothetical protein
MTFKTDGSTHTHGIKNEHDMIAFLNDRGIFSKQVIHLGGTKNKADAIAGDKKISIKHKKGINNGSFDWINTSQIEALTNREQFQEFLSTVAALRFTDDAASQVEPMREIFANLCRAGLDSIESDDLTVWLKDQLVNANSNMAMVITDTLTDKVYICEHDAIASVRLLNDGYVAELVNGKGSTSRKVVLRKGDHTVDTGLRLRLTSNNGITAFLGLSKANKNSQVVLKLQQDNVGRVLQTAEGVKTLSI